MYAVKRRIESRDVDLVEHGERVGAHMISYLAAGEAIAIEG